MLLSNSSEDSFTPILQCSTNIVQGEGGYLTFHVFSSGVASTFRQDCKLNNVLSLKHLNVFKINIKFEEGVAEPRNNGISRKYLGILLNSSGIWQNFPEPFG